MLLDSCEVEIKDFQGRKQQTLACLISPLILFFPHRFCIKQMDHEHSSHLMALSHNYYWEVNCTSWPQWDIVALLFMPEWKASLLQSYSSCSMLTYSLAHIYTPSGWGETVWCKVSCLKKQCKLNNHRTFDLTRRTPPNSLEIEKKIKFIPCKVRVEGPCVAEVHSFVEMCVADGKLSVDHRVRQKHERVIIFYKTENNWITCTYLWDYNAQINYGSSRIP